MAYRVPVSVAAALAVSLIAPMQAANACWDQNEAAAAKLRDLQSKLMVETLRCKAIGIDVHEAYNGFVRSNRETIQAANATMKAEFVEAGGARATQEYDRFATALANAYGEGLTTTETCAATSSLAHEASAAEGDIQALLALAEKAGSQPALPGQRCPIVFATADSGAR